MSTLTADINHYMQSVWIEQYQNKDAHSVSYADIIIMCEVLIKPI